MEILDQKGARDEKEQIKLPLESLPVELVYHSTHFRYC
jgi:hypothetical protein